MAEYMKVADLFSVFASCTVDIATVDRFMYNPSLQNKKIVTIKDNLYKHPVLTQYRQQ